MKNKRAPFVVAVLAALPAFACVSHPSSRPGRETNAARLWFESDAVVVAKCVEAGRADGGHKVTVDRVARGTVKVGDTFLLPRAAVPQYRKGEEAGETPVVMTNGDTYVLFLKKSGNDWLLSQGTVWDGYLDGKPEDFDLLPCGGARVAGALDECETWETVLAMATLDAVKPADRIPGISLLYRSRWHSGYLPHANPSALLDQLGEEEARKALDSMIEKDFDQGSWGDLESVLRAIRWKLPSMLALARAGAKNGAPGYSADGVLIAMGTDEERGPALGRVVDTLRRFPAQGEIVTFLAALKNAPLDARVRTIFEGAAKSPPDWTDVGASLPYLQLRGILGNADVKRLAAVAGDAEARGTRWEIARPAIEELERITGVSFALEPGSKSRAPLMESKKWAEWWEKKGSRIEKYR